MEQIGRFGRREVAASALPFVALVLQAALWSVLDPYVWFLFFPAVFAAAWIGGRRAGFVATAISVGIVWLVFMPPRGSLAKDELSGALLSSVMFVGMGVAFAVLNGRLRRANDDLRAANESVSELLERTRELDERRSQLFANVSHELRTPLALIVAPVERLLSSSRVTGDDREQLERVDRNAQLLREQVDDLLEAATIAGGGDLRYGHNDLAAIARMVGSDFAELAASRGITLEVDAPDPLPAALDGEKIRRALAHIVANACKFTPDGGRVRIRASRSGASAVVEVADSGPGIPPDRREEIFERFHQLEAGPTRRHGGAGLGLAISRDIARLHGGDCTADESAEGGAKLTLTVPFEAPAGVDVAVGPAVASAGAARPRWVPDEPAGARRAGSPTVLVVEDNDDLNHFLCRALGDSYEVVSARDGIEGLARAREQRPDIVVTDVMMPGMSGEDLVHELRADAALRDVRIIMVTAKAEQSFLGAALRDGADDVLLKPFTVEALLARVEHQVAERHLALESRERVLQHQRMLAQSESARTVLQATLDFAVDGIVTIDPDGTILDANPAAHTMFGYRDGQLPGQDVAVLMGETDAAVHAASVERYLRTGVRHIIGTTRTVTGRRSDGTTFALDLRVADIDEPGVPRMFTAILHDASLRVANEEAYRRLAVTDPLTGVANRSAVLDRLGQLLLRLEREPGGIAVLFLDLDRFKTINDSLGHSIGDRLLRSVTERLGRILRPSDTLGRLGGDEFVIICADGLHRGDEAEHIVARVEATLAPPHHIDGHEIVSTASIGIVEIADSTVTAEEVLRRADLAMYRAKDRGRNRHELYATALEETAATKLALQNDLRDAILGGTLEVHHQPIVDLETGAIFGTEALVRFRDRDDHLLTPDHFLDVAESSGLIAALDEQVLGKACVQLAAWTDRSPDLRLAFNVSSQLLTSGHLHAAVLDHAHRAGVELSRLCIEVSERSLIEITQRPLDDLLRLRAEGVRIAIDDFGTGFSSLARLKELPIDVIKIDRSFTVGLDVNADDTAIIGAVTRLANDLGLCVVAEGVERPEQLEGLRRLGCQHVQGWLLARPAPAEEITPLLGADVLASHR